MKYKQNDRILQLSPKTLVVGMDIASNIHYARAFNYRGVEFGNVISFSNDAEGFAKLLSWADAIAKSEHMEKLLFGAEPTGHYWFNLAQYLKDSNLKLVLVNPFHVSRSKELDDNNPTKNDRKDPKTIAKLVIDGRYMDPYIPEGVYSDLRIAMDNRRRIVGELNTIKNRMSRWLKIYYPEFIGECFSDWDGIGATIVLKTFPLPEDVITAGVDGINALWRKEKLRTVGRSRAVRLLEAAKRSVGVREGLISARAEIKMLFADYDHKMAQYAEIMTVVEALVKQVPNSDKLLDIKGIGLVTAAGFISEVGDINRFEDPRQIQKYAGLALRENSSGNHKGETTINKRGRKLLRALLFKAAMPLVAKNPEFGELHRYYTSRTNNPLKKKQSLIAIACKLIRIFYVLLTKGVSYDPMKMVSDIRRTTNVHAA